MREHNVDFIGGDFNMSAFSTVGDVFTDQEFSAPNNSLLWDLVHWKSRIANVLVFSSCQSDLTSGVSIHMVATNLTMRYFGLGPRDQSAHLPVFLHLRNTNLPGPSSIMRSDQAQQRRFERRHNKERMQRRRSSRKCTDCDPFLQGILSDSFLHF